MKDKDFEKDGRFCLDGRKEVCGKHKPKVPSLKILTHVGSFMDFDGDFDSLPSEKSGLQLVRRTSDLKDLFLTKSGSMRDLTAVSTPFGPKTSAFIIPAKNFDAVDVEMEWGFDIKSAKS